MGVINALYALFIRESAIFVKKKQFYAINLLFFAVICAVCLPGTVMIYSAKMAASRRKLYLMCKCFGI